MSEVDWPEVEKRLLPLAQAAEGIPSAHQRAAVALCLCVGEYGLEVLLMRRVETADDPWSGQISLPGGHAEHQDEDLLGTATRETREEVGLDLEERARFLGALPNLQARARGGFLQTTIVPLVFSLEGRCTTSPGPEAAGTFWFPLTRAQAGGLSGTLPYERSNGELVQLPCWRFEGHVVWGLTYRILSSLLEHAKAALPSIQASTPGEAQEPEAGGAVQRAPEQDAPDDRSQAR